MKLKFQFLLFALSASAAGINAQQINDSNKDRFKDLFKKRKDRYRRWRDMSFFVLVGVYALSVIDAYVDAELSHFDISPDLSLNIEPRLMMDHMGAPIAGFSLAFNFK